MEGRRGAYRALVGRAKRNKSLGRSRSRWEDNVKRILKKPMEGHGVTWSGSGYGQMEGSCEHGNESSGSKKYGDDFD
jgi:hypothetical protein